VESLAGGQEGSELELKMQGKHKILTLTLTLSIFLLISCKKAVEEQTIEPQKESPYKIELSPLSAKRDDIITVKVSGADPQDLSYQWIVNGTEIEGAKGNTLNYPKLKKKDSVQVMVSIKGQGEFISEPLVIANTIPQIQSARLIPSDPKRGENIKVEVKAFDGDGDGVRITYAWFINGERAYETSDTLSGTLIKKGDKVSVKITPSDGEQDGESITLYAIVVNSPPAVSTNIEARFDGFTYTSRINAQDPDGDPLTYTIKHGPEGMTIDSKGVITWKVKLEDRGKHNIIVSVSDGSGGEVIVPFTTSIGFTEK